MTTSGAVFRYKVDEYLLNPCRQVVLWQNFIFNTARFEVYLKRLDISKQKDENERKAYLLSLDPINWKEFDHYMIFGYKKQRYLISQEEIKTEYRKLILLYHPDKGEHSSLLPEDVCNRAFVCISKSYSILSDPKKRHQYDSVDPSFSDKVPPVIDPKILVEKPNIFFSTFGPVFKMNERFSKRKPVPELGDTSCSRVEIQRFYAFWNTFESTRTFEYLDKEDTEQAANRQDRRYIEKLNVLTRNKLKKQERERIQKLVKHAMKSDPRIIFSDGNVTKKPMARSRLPNTILKKEEGDNGKKKIDFILEKLSSISIGEERLDDISKYISHLGDDFLTKTQNHIQDNGCSEDVLRSIITDIENRNDVPRAHQPNCNLTEVLNPKDNSTKSPGFQWNEEEQRLLVKAVNAFPGGYSNRWEKVSEYIHIHSGCPQRSVSDVVSKYKEVKTISSRHPVTK